MDKKNTKKRIYEEKIPKVAELVSSLCTFMDSESDYGSDYGMTRLSKEIELKRPKGKIGNPSVGTLRNKLTEFFLMSDALKDWNPVWKISKKNKTLDRVRKEEPKEINMATISDLLVNIHKDIKIIKDKLGEK